MKVPIRSIRVAVVSKSGLAQCHETDARSGTSKAFSGTLVSFVSVHQLVFCSDTAFRERLMAMWESYAR
eukprot:2715905-Amphidinium_carterae.1